MDFANGAQDGVPRLCFVLDTHGSGRGTVPEQKRDQRRWLAVMKQACRDAGVRRDACERQERGDGELLVLPRGTSVTRTVPDLLRCLKLALDADNASRLPEARLRLRVAMAFGVADYQLGAGWTGAAVREACGLADAEELKVPLSGAPGATLLFAVGSFLYGEVVSQGYGGLDPATFGEMRVALKGVPHSAWVQLHEPGGAGPADRPPPVPPLSGEPPPGAEVPRESRPGGADLRGGSGAAGRGDAAMTLGAYLLGRQGGGGSPHLDVLVAGGAPPGGGHPLQPGQPGRGSGVRGPGAPHDPYGGPDPDGRHDPEHRDDPHGHDDPHGDHHGHGDGHGDPHGYEDHHGGTSFAAEGDGDAFHGLDGLADGHDAGY